MMDIKIFNAKKYDINVKELKQSILNICIHQKLSGYIGIEFVSNKKIQELNKKHRNTNKPTDVLSFSTKTPQKNQVFGEIIISPEIAKKESVQIEDLIIHGIIHLLGYDHQTEKEEKEWKKFLKIFVVNHKVE